jgi:taurine dioxygenase
MRKLSPSITPQPAAAGNASAGAHASHGRKALFLNPVRMESIVGMEDADALKLIDDLMRHATQKKYEYRHKWRPGD